MAKINTRTARRNLTPRNEPYWLIISPGLAIGYRRGVKIPGTWQARFTTPDKKFLRKRLGSADDLPDADPARTLDYTAALKAAEEWFGTQSTATVSGRQMTVGVAMEMYVAKLGRENTDSTVEITPSAINKHILPTFEDTLISDLTKRSVRAWRDSLVDKGLARSTANRLLTILKAGLNLAFHNEYINSNQAWAAVERYKNADVPRDVFFTKKQVDVFMKGARKRDADFADICEANFYAGTRPGLRELSQLQVKDVDLASGRIAIKESKTGPRSVVIPKAGLAVFERRIKGKKPNDPVFTRKLGGLWGSATMSPMFRDVLAATGLPSDAVPYTLRHSHISLALLNGLNIQLLAENCGTSVEMISKHYAKFSEKDRRRLIDAAFIE